MGRLIKKTIKEAFYSEDEAKEAIEEIKKECLSHAVTLKSFKTEYVTKKSKGEIIGELWVNTVVTEHDNLWNE